MASVFLPSCKDDDDDASNNVSATISMATDVKEAITASEIAGAEIILTSTQSKDTYKFEVPKSDNKDASGVVNISVPAGVYDINMEKTVNGKTIFLKKENVTIKGDGQVVEVKLITTVANSEDFQLIFSELFFNGEKNAGRMMHPDQYMVIYNPTNNVLYADGVAIGSTLQASCQEKQSWFDEYYNAGKVPVHGVIVIPGSGYEHPIKPHGKIVIAFTAVNHTHTEDSYKDVNENGDTITVNYTYENAVDLSGADFEIYDPQLYTSDVDNPEVPNVKEICHPETDFAGFGGFYLHPRGFYNAFIFKLENGEQNTIDKFFKDNSSVTTVKDKENNDVQIPIFSVPASMILDGITTGHVPSGIVTNPLPSTIDRGEQLVKGCHSGLLIKRKGSDAEGYADTNNSTVDCEIVTPQTAYPLGWRNK